MQLHASAECTGILSEGILLIAPPSPPLDHRNLTELRLHGMDAASVVGALPEVHPTAQADTERLRARFPRLVDDGRAESVMGCCEWVDRVLDGGPAQPEVLVHGDLHGHNQVWDPASVSLRGVVDFRHFDLRYLPSNARDAGREEFEHAPFFTRVPAPTAQRLSPAGQR